MGKIGILETLTVIVAILWVLGIFRWFIIPVNINVNRNEAQPENKKEASKSISSETYGKDSEFVDYEEVE